MKQFIIYHPYDGVLNNDLIRDQYMYAQVAEVTTDTLEDCFRLGQNDFNPEYAKLGNRSTSVGDIIVDVEEQLHYFVAGIEFTEIPCTVTQYIDWGIVDQQREKDRV